MLTPNWVVLSQFIHLYCSTCVQSTCRTVQMTECKYVEMTECKYVYNTCKCQLVQAPTWPDLTHVQLEINIDKFLKKIN